MKAVAQILVAFAPCLLASAVPFMRVFRGRGKGFKRPFFLCWVLFVFWITVFSLVVPGVAALFDRDLARTIQTSWVPEGPAVAAAAFMGWLYAAITLLLASFARLLAARFMPELLSNHDS
jgi:lysylphosphatidylglycerol synthetase-like protein (DUF2156 family)